MIDYFQQNKSNRATCQRCKNFITDKMRGVEETTGYYYCLKCCEERIQQAKKDLQSMEDSLRFQFDKIKR